MASIILHAYVSGRVQGVGFRFNTKWMGDRYQLRGWVRNLDDGRVEVKAEGPKTQLEDFLTWLKHGPRHARVDRVDYKFLDVNDEKFSLQEFEIVD